MVCFCSASAQAKALTVMISGGFKTAWETLGPRFAAQEGYSIKTVSGPSMAIRRRRSRRGWRAGKRRTW